MQINKIITIPNARIKLELISSKTRNDSEIVNVEGIE